MFDLVFHAPEIAPNTGNAMRLVAVTGCRLHLIEPLGFTLDDARLRRAGLDYRDLAPVSVHPDIDVWHGRVRPKRVFAFTVDGSIRYDQVEYLPGDALLFGPESVGLPAEIKQRAWVSSTVRLPMVPGVRSINLSNAAAIVIFEAWRQLGFEGSA